MNKGQEERVQVHYHYHYYQDDGQDRGSRHRDNDRMSKSEIFAGWVQDSETSLKEEGKKEPMHGTYLKGRERSFSKLRISNCWSTDNPTSSQAIQQKSDETPYVSAFIVKEQQMSIGEQSPTSNKHQHRRNISLDTLASNSYENGVIAEYEEQLRWYKSQMERLKSIEEECVYLRQQCLMHYQGCKKEEQ